MGVVGEGIGSPETGALKARGPPLLASILRRRSCGLGTGMVGEDLGIAMVVRKWGEGGRAGGCIEGRGESEIQPRQRNKNRILKNFNGLHQSSFFTK